MDEKIKPGIEQQQNPEAKNNLALWPVYLLLFLLVASSGGKLLQSLGTKLQLDKLNNLNPATITDTEIQQLLKDVLGDLVIPEMNDLSLDASWSIQDFPETIFQKLSWLDPAVAEYLVAAVGKLTADGKTLESISPESVKAAITNAEEAIDQVQEISNDLLRDPATKALAAEIANEVNQAAMLLNVVTEARREGVRISGKDVGNIDKYNAMVNTGTTNVADAQARYEALSVGSLLLTIERLQVLKATIASSNVATDIQARMADSIATIILALFGLVLLRFSKQANPLLAEFTKYIHRHRFQAEQQRLTEIMDPTALDPVRLNRLALQEGAGVTPTTPVPGKKSFAGKPNMQKSQ